MIWPISNKPIFGSAYAEAFFRALRPQGPAGSRSFPKGATAPRFKGQQGLLDWLTQVDDLSKLSVDDGMLLWGSVSWDVKFAARRQETSTFPLCRASVEVVIATGDEEATIEAVIEGRTPFQYLRLDYDLSALGSIFKEPAPHIHVHIDGEPRFPGCYVLGDLPIANFVDFIFRNWRHKEWANWLYESWYDRFVEKDEDDLFEEVSTAYAMSNLTVLQREDAQKAIESLRRHLHEEKRSRCPLVVPEPLWSILQP